jgi:hypothetical protein
MARVSEVDIAAQIARAFDVPLSMLRLSEAEFNAWLHEEESLPDWRDVECKLHTDLRRPFVMGPERREAHERALRKATLYSPRRRSRGPDLP